VPFAGLDPVVAAERLGERLTALGLTQVLHARNGAVAALAAQLLPALLADQLGLSIFTAAARSKLSAPHAATMPLCGPTSSQSPPSGRTNARGACSRR
jgi:hypothetical protein